MSKSGDLSRRQLLGGAAAVGVVSIAAAQYGTGWFSDDDPFFKRVENSFGVEHYVFSPDPSMEGYPDPVITERLLMELNSLADQLLAAVKIGMPREIIAGLTLLIEAQKDEVILHQRLIVEAFAGHVLALSDERFTLVAIQDLSHASQGFSDKLVGAISQSGEDCVLVSIADERRFPGLSLAMEATGIVPEARIYRGRSFLDFFNGNPPQQDPIVDWIRGVVEAYRGSVPGIQASLGSPSYG